MTKNNSFKFMHIHEYDGSPRALKDLFVYEKIDGGNCSVRKEDGILVPYSRSRKLTQQDIGSFYFRNFFNWVYSVPELFNLSEDKILCGEWTHYGFGHICYNTEYMNKFFLLGVFDKNANKYLHPKDIDKVVDSLKIEDKIIRLPVLRKGSIDESITEELIEVPSNFYNGPKEGIVIHKYGNSFKQGLRMEKYFNREFREIDNNKSGIDKYVTKRRLIKAIQNLKTYGKNLSFESAASVATEDILREYKEYKRKELLDAFFKPEIEVLFEERVVPLFQREKKF